jgi:hypothetical protein
LYVIIELHIIYEKRARNVFGNPQNFSVYLNDELQEEKITAGSSREAAEAFAAQKGIEGSWSMGSSKFMGTNGESIRVKTHY